MHTSNRAFGQVKRYGNALAGRFGFLAYVDGFIQFPVIIAELLRLLAARVVDIELGEECLQFVQRTVDFFYAGDVFQLLFVLSKPCVQLVFAFVELIDECVDLKVGEEVADVIFVFIGFAFLVVQLFPVEIFGFRKRYFADKRNVGQFGADG